MFERDALVRNIEHLLAAARQGTGGAIFVVGEAGLGKTAVLDRACKLAAPTARVGFGRADVMEAALPFGVMVQAIDDVGGPAVPEYGVASATAEDVRASQFHRVLRWLQAIADEDPVLLALDDLHWSDPDSLALVSYLCRRISGLAVAIVGTLRPWPPAAEEMCRGLTQTGHAAIERLQPLTEEAARRMLAGRVSRSLPADVLVEACASTGGNPLLLERVALALDTGDWPGGVAGSSGAGEVLPLRRFAGLPDEGIRWAQAASVLGSRFRSEVAAAVARLEEGQAELAVEALSLSGLVRHAGPGLAEFTYPLFRQALYGDLAPLVREELHTRAFRLLLERGMEAEAAEHAMRANLAGDIEAIGLLTRAGRTALWTGAVATAVERLERAVSLAAEQPEPELMLLLGEALLAADRADKALGVYEHVLERPDIATPTRTEALRMLGRALFLTGDVVQSERRFEEAAALAPDDRPEDAVQAILDLSRAAWLTAGPAGALPAAVRARAIAGNAADALREQGDAAWGFLAFISGDASGLAATAAAGEAAVANDESVVRDLFWSWGTLRNSGRAAKYAERFAEAEAVFNAMFLQAEDIGSPHAMVSLAAHHADTLARQGRLDEAWRLAARAVGLAELAPMAAAFAHAVEAWLLLHAGRLDESEEFCRRAESVASARGQWLPRLRVWHLRALRHLRDGRFDEACGLYDDLEAETIRLGIAEPCMVPWARGAVVAHLGRGRPADAERVVAWVEASAERLPCRWPRIAAHAGRAALADAEGDPSSAEVHFRAALALHDEVDLPLEHVQTLSQWGGFLRRTGQMGPAREALREALTVAESRGSVWLAGQVRDELAVAGGRRSRARSPMSLTPQERRVAELAATGRSRREIAGQLSVSVRTVETHLYRAYAKLGIHSQRELMARAGHAGQDWSPPEKGLENT